MYLRKDQKIRFKVLVILLLSFTKISSQNPSYYTLGKSELRNTDIYSVLHTKDQKLYIATDEGLYRYVHGKMKPIPPAKHQKGNSLYHLTENSKSEVFCLNLNGQIFKIKDDKLELYFEIPEEYESPNFQIAFDYQDRLVIGGDACLSYDGNEVKELYNRIGEEQIYVSKLLDGRIVVKSNHIDSVSILKNDSIFLHHVHNNTQVIRQQWQRRHHILELEGELYSNFYLQDAILRYRSIHNKKDYFDHHQINENEIWTRSSYGGIYVIKLVNGRPEVVNTHFENTFISIVSVDNQENIFLGTFGRGLLVIPSKRTKSYKNRITAANLQHIVADQTNVFVSDINKGIIALDKNSLKVKYLKGINPNRLFILERNHCPSNSYGSLFYNDHSGLGDIKNIYEVDSITLIAATSSGIFKVGPSEFLSDSMWHPSDVHFNSFRSNVFNNRTVGLAYNHLDSIFYVAEKNKVEFLDKRGELQQLKFNNEPLIVNDITFENGVLWCATPNNGILGFKDHILKYSIGDQEGLGNNFVSKIRIKDNKIYLSHMKGFQIYDLDEKKWNTIGTSEGVENGSIKDFYIDNSTIWFISDNDVISYNLEDTKKESSNIQLKIDSVCINDQSFDQIDQIKLNHDENNIEIYITHLGLNQESETTIKYSLTNLEENRAIKEDEYFISNEKLEFKYLSPGNYRFSLSSQYRNEIVASESFDFEIKQAFWKTPLFQTLSILFSILAIGILFKLRHDKIIQENIDRLKRQKLIADAVSSELKSLRSQMNPHFIFNSLNSIQDLILQKDFDSSYDYLVIFSELVRSALNYSNQELISLNQEMAFLERYLKLEKLRFGDDFSYSIRSTSNLELMIPSILLQPFVENAVVHGIFHKEGDKKISILFENDEDELRCTITDNGVGFSEEHKRKNHQSFALKSIRKRMEILNRKYGNNFRFEIDNKQVGTSVLVVIPIIKVEDKIPSI